MKDNYVFNSIDVSKITIPKVIIISKKQKKINNKIRKEREYNKRIPRKYNLYIKSKFWFMRRNKYFQKFGRKCFICNSSKFCQIHHLEYNNNYFGIEKDDMLVCLCSNCHEEFHLKYGTSKRMYDEFNEFIDVKKGIEQLKYL